MVSNLERISYPSIQAVSDEEVKGYLLLKKLPTEVSSDLTEQIKEAIDEVESRTRRSLMSARFRLTLDCWPATCIIPLDRYPVVMVNHVKYVDENGNWIPMTENIDWRLDRNSAPGRILMLNTPSLSSDYLSPIEIHFIAGASHVSSVPLRAKRAVKLFVALSFQNRQDEVVKGITKAEKLCRSIAIKRF